MSRSTGHWTSVNPERDGFEQEDVAIMPHSTGHWASVKQEAGGFEQDDDRHGGALCPFPRMSFKAATPPRYSGHEEASTPLLS